MTASQSAIDAIGYNGSNIGIIPGEKIPLESLLQAMLISSANEAANIIAETYVTALKSFELMNRRQRNWELSKHIFPMQAASMIPCISPPQPIWPALQGMQ